MDLVNYQPPGVTTELLNRGTAPGYFYLNTCVAIIGEVTEQYYSVLDEIFVPVEFDVPILLKQRRIKEDSEVVSDYSSTTVQNYTRITETNPDGDYNFDYYNGTITFVTKTTPIVTPGTSLYIDYDYVRPGFYEPQDFYNFEDLISLYGPPLNDIGDIQSPMVLAAQFAFNSAPWVKAFAVDPIDPAYEDDDPNKDIVDDGDFERTIDDQCTRFVEIDMMVCCSNSQAVRAKMVSHIEAMNTITAKRERMWFTSYLYDESITTKAFGTGENDLNMGSAAHPLGYQNENIVFMCPCGVEWWDAYTRNADGSRGKNMRLHGYYLCAALAGLLASYSVIMPLTRRKLMLFKNLSEHYSPDQANTLAARGVTIIENFNSYMQVRHGLTTDTSYVESQEISVVRGCNFMKKYLRSKVDETFIGHPIETTTYLSIYGYIDAQLIILKNNKIIFGYQNLAVRPDPSDPTAIIVYFEYCPTYGLNYIRIQFAVNTTALSQATTTTAAQSGTLT